MTFSVLKALHSIIGDAIDDIERIYAEASAPTSPSSGHSTPGASSAVPSSPYTTNKVSNTLLGHSYASPPPSPLVSSYGCTAIPRPTTPTSPTSPSSNSNFVEFPSLDVPYEANSPSELMTSHPVVISAINRIVAAAGQMSATVQIPFLTLCDAGMGYHLPSCLRLLEATHTVEILRAAGPNGLHVTAIAEKIGVDRNKLAHIFRLLASHHILREVTPDVFANNRISSLLDTGKPFEELRRSPENKYEDTNGIAAFFGTCTDELFKASGYLTEAYYLSPQRHKNREPTRAPFNYAFGCEGVGFFGWLEGEGIEGTCVNGPGREKGLIPGVVPTASTAATSMHKRKGSLGTKGDMYSKGTGLTFKESAGGSASISSWPQTANPAANPNNFRLKRFGKAMTGTESWEVPGAVLNGFDWLSLPKESIVVDVGGGIGSTSMLLAHAFSTPYGSNEEDVLGLKFIIQDREIVCDMGEKAWRAQCPELLDSGIARFQVHDFFTPQPIKNAAVFLLRVVLHDWPDAYAQRILLRLREASKEDTKLLIADFVLPLACADDFGISDDATEDGANIQDVQGAERMLAPAPLLANLGKSSANVYWMDMTMQVMFNGQERTLREIVSLARSAGWKVTKVTKAPGSLFGHIVAVPVDIPIQKRAREGSGSAFMDVPKSSGYMGGVQDDETFDIREMGRASSRCGTPTFGSRMDLPSFEEARARFGGGYLRGATRRAGTTASGAYRPSLRPSGVPIVSAPKKKRPSPLAVVPQSPSPVPPRSVTSSPRPPVQPPHSPLNSRKSHSQLSHLYRSPQQPSPASTPITRQPPPSPLSPRNSTKPAVRSLSRHSSVANLSHHSTLSQEIHPPPLPVLTSGKPVRQSGSFSPVPLSTSTTNRSDSPLITSSPVASRSSLARRQSSAQLSPSAIPISRKRSESILAYPASLGGRANTLMRTLELSGLGSGSGTKTPVTPSRALDFGERIMMERDGQDSRDDSPIIPPGSVLAAAAHIEKSVSPSQLRSQSPTH